MFGIGGTELAIILVFGFLLFGPDKLPQMGRTLGRALRQFRETQEKMTSVVQTEVIDPMAAVVKDPGKSAHAKKQDPTITDDDLDSDVPTSLTSHKKETFAERRARLAAERAEKEQAKAEEDTSTQEPESEDTTAVLSADDPQDAPAPAHASGDTMPAVRTDAPSGTEGRSKTTEGAVDTPQEAGSRETPAVEVPTDEDLIKATENLYARRPRTQKASAHTEGGDE